MGSLFTIGLIVAILAAAAVGLYLYTRSNGENPLFAPRERRRLAYVERAHLDGGRKLVLIRRDDVEHLLLVGGPIDLVIETGIPAEPQPRRETAGTTGDVFGAVQSYADSARTWQRGFGLGGGKSGGAAQPGHSLAVDGKGGEPNGEDTLELTTAHEAKR